MGERAARRLRGILLLAGGIIVLWGGMIGIQVPPLYWLIALGIAWKRGRRIVGSSWSHGSAKLGTMVDLLRNSMLGDEGLILGTTGYMQRPSRLQGIAALFSRSASAESACMQFLSAFGSRWASNRRIRIKNYVHLATFAATGRGKGVSVLIPNLLTHAGSCVVTDPKGELFTITSEHRRKKLGHRIFRLDPEGICGPGADTFNPMLFLDPNDAGYLDQCRDLANMLVVREADERDPHWNNCAEIVITAFIAFVRACDPNPACWTLYTVRDLLSSRHTFANAVARMQATKSHRGVIERLGHILSWFQDKELGSVLTTVQRHTAFLDSPSVSICTDTNTLDPKLLRSGRTTIYLCLKHDKLETLAPLMRLWIGSIIRIITRGKADERNPVLFFLDEAAHLGKILVLEQAVTLMRGMGIRLWFFFQSLSQVHDCFGKKAATILDNLDTQQFFGINAFVQADEVSKRIGDSTIPIRTWSSTEGYQFPTGGNGGEAGNYSSSRSSNFSDLGRRLLKPEEIMLLPEDAALICHRNMRVITSRLIPYFKDPEFQSGVKPARTGWMPKIDRVTVILAVAVALMSVIALVRTVARARVPEPRPAYDVWDVTKPFPSP